MSATRKLLLTLAVTLLVVGFVLSSPLPTEAGPTSPCGTPYCTFTNNPCFDYCRPLGWPYGLCNSQTHCCVCSD